MKATFLFVGRNIDIYEEVIKEFSKTFNVISEKWNGITKQSKINSEKSNIIFCDGCQDIYCMVIFNNKKELYIHK